ncbi:MAG: hypothetical protein ACLQVD_01520 [Capsulimonadaceae bacterium]
MEKCPKCNRKLISHSSPTCNWCGEPIIDAEYMLTSHSNRRAALEAETEHHAAMLAASRAMVTHGFDGHRLSQVGPTPSKGLSWRR